jgi:transposase, IS5 family
MCRQIRNALASRQYKIMVTDWFRPPRGRKFYSLHAPEVGCIGRGKAHKPYEFGVKVSVATALLHSRGGQFVAMWRRCPATRMTATP